MERLFFNIVIFLAMSIFILIGLTSADNIKKYIKNFKENGLKWFLKRALSIWVKPSAKLYKDAGIFSRLCLIAVSIGTAIIIFYASYKVNVNKYGLHLNIYIFLIIFLEAISILVVLYTIFLIGLKIVDGLILDYLIRVKKYIGNLAIASLMIPILVLVTLGVNTESSNLMIYLGFIGLIFSHYIIFKGLFLIIDKPDFLSAKMYKLNKYSKYIGMIVWLLILVFNLYSAVLVVSRIDSSAFVNNDNQFINNPMELLYFTVTSIITIGYGDITPNSPWGKGVMLLIFSSGFYYLVIFIGTVLTASISNKATLYGFINRRVNLIVNNLNELLSNIEKESGIDIPRNEISKSNIFRALSSINIKSKSLVLNEHDYNGNWIKYLNYSKKHCLKNIREISIFSIQLEPEILNILLEIEDSDYFELLDNIYIEVTSNNNLGFMTNRFIEYILQIYELEKYRKANLEEYKRERRRLLTISEDSDKVNNLKRDEKGDSVQG